jgi:hypothetical protein
MGRRSTGSGRAGRRGSPTAAGGSRTAWSDVFSVRPLDGHRLRLRFEDGTEGDVDVAAIVGAWTGVFEPLRKRGYFAKVRVDRSLGTVCWPNGADIAPETLYAALTGRSRGPRPPSEDAPREPPAPGTESPVPEICRFFGIVIQMFYNEKHAPHFHARYGGRKAAIEIEALRILSGRLPPRVHGLVAEWATLHRDELLENWERARRGRRLRRIEPLE